MPNPMHMPNSWMFGTEWIFSIIIVLLCFLIYYKTKEIFNLTNHKGIYHFRTSFLFLGIAYLLRLLFRSSIMFEIFVRGKYFKTGFFVIGFFSTVAIMHLFLSVSWKKFKRKPTKLMINLLATIISLFSFLSGEPTILILTQLTLLVLTVIIAFDNKFNKNKSKLFLIYVLLFIFWAGSLIPFGSRKYFSFDIIPIVHIVSITIFLVIYYKVNKWIK